MKADVHLYTTAGICSFGRKSKRVSRHEFLDSPVLQDERQVCLSMNCKLVCGFQFILKNFVYTLESVANESWMGCRLNLDHIRALCRQYPCMIQDALIKRIEEETMESSRVEGKFLGWKSSLEELKEGLSQGLLTWLPLDVSSSTS